VAVALVGVVTCCCCRRHRKGRENLRFQGLNFKDDVLDRFTEQDLGNLAGNALLSCDGVLFLLFVVASCFHAVTDWRIFACFFAFFCMFVCCIVFSPVVVFTCQRFAGTVMLAVLIAVFSSLEFRTESDAERDGKTDNILKRYMPS
jgi:hypothetical protein